MSQFFQVASLEELHRIYPNLQFENEDGVTSVVQDDKGTQYINEQGQQIITAVESSGMQFSSPSSSQQCHLQQPQFIVHQPTQYVIHQMDASEPQQTAVQYVQQRPQPNNTLTKKENLEIRCQDQGVENKATGTGEEQPLQQCIVKVDGSKQYVSQLQPLLRQPIQIHQQISTGGNILELQSQDQSVVGSISNHESSTNLQESQDKQNSQTLLHSVKRTQINIPTSSVQETQDHVLNNQVLHNTHVPLSVNQQQIMHQSRQQILQSVRYYNQLTVIDGFPSSSETVDQNTSENIIQQQHVILPQEFEMPNQSALASRIAMSRKLSQQDVDGSVFLLGEIKSPFLVREAQPKLCFQSSVPGSDKTTEDVSTQSVPQNEHTIVQETSLSSRPELPSKMNISEPKILSDSKNISIHQFPRFSSPPLTRLRSPFPPIQSTSAIQAQNRTPFRGRGGRGFSQRGPRQYVPRAPRAPGTSPPRPANIRGSNIRGGKSLQGRRLSKPECVSKILDERQESFPRAPAPVNQSPVVKEEPCQTVKEPLEEARMVVFLGNGEKKIVRVPCTPNIVITQILQQAGIPVTNSTPLTVEQITDTHSNHFIIKTCSQKLPTPFKGTGATQVITSPNSLVSRSIVGTVQQRPRIQSPHSPHPTNLNIVRHNLQLTPRMANCSRTSVVTSGSQSPAENSAPPLIPREEPRYVPGFMAICPFCGISSLDFNKCIRCRRKLPENVKSHPIFCQKKKKTPGSEKISTGSDKDSKSEGEDKLSDSFDSKEKNSPGSDKKKVKICQKKKKIHDEPTEILILSSDEEEDNKTKKTSFNPLTLSKLKKEPDYSDLKELEMAVLSTDGSLSEDLMKNKQPGSFTTLFCRTIRIGSFKIQPKERVFVSAKGIRLAVHSLKNEPVVIIIPVSDIVKALIHFGKQIPVVFIYPLPKIAEQIRNMLGMENKNGPYYDPTSSKEEVHKRITILLEKITEDNKMALQKVFASDKLEELSEKEANEILLRASLIDVQNTNTNRIEDNVRKIMVYPPPPEKGGITLNNQDYACLGEDQFLNDVIIDFYLKYLMLKVLSPADRNRTHVFSTFFYKRLTTKPKRLRKNDPENDPKLSPAEKRHMRVKGWTKQVNLFEKDFIIVPINEHSHWFLAIICFPGLTGPVKFSDNTPVEPEEISPKKNSETVQIGSTTITHIIKSDGNTINLGTDSGSDRDEAEGDQDDLHPSSDEESEQAEEESGGNSSSVQIPLLTASQSSPAASLPHAKDSKVKACKKKVFKEPIKQPCILIFDSLAGASRVRVVATLRDYLKIEYKKKMGQDRDFSKDTIKGAVPKVPQQNNFTDCGLYVLQYVESFFQDPLHDFKLPLKYLQDWFPEEIVSCKRQKLATLIRSLMEEQGLNVEEMGLPQLTFGSGKNPSDDQKLEEEEEEIEDEDELNEEEEELLRRYTHKNLALGEEHDPCDDVEDEENEEEEEENEDFGDEGEDELEPGEIPRQWYPKASGSCGDFESAGKHHGSLLYRTTAIVDYDPSDTGEEDEEDDERGQMLTFNPTEVFDENQTNQCEKVEVEKFNDKQAGIEKRKNVPLIDYQDFESQIRCTTIERSFDGSECGSDTGTDGELWEDEEAGAKGVTDEEGNCVETYDGAGTVLKTYNKPLKTVSDKETLVKDSKSREVTDIIKKLVNDKSITISRKEEEVDTSHLQKHLGVKKLKPEDCDKIEEVEKAGSPGLPDKRTLSACKRSFQALKNVRIQKKADRNSDISSKRQKVDDR